MLPSRGAEFAEKESAANDDSALTSLLWTLLLWIASGPGRDRGGWLHVRAGEAVPCGKGSVVIVLVILEVHGYG